MYALGREKVSCLEKCPQFRGVLIEGFHCTPDPKVVVQYGGAQGPVLISNVECSGNETSLLECVHTDQAVVGDRTGSHYGADIGVSCGECVLHSYFPGS